MSLINELDNLGICYAVGVAQFNPKSNEIEASSKDYHVIISISDSKKIKGYYLKQSGDKKINTMSIDMDEDSILFFKKNQSKYTKVVHNKYGRIYEIVGNSFESHYSNQHN